MTKEFFLDLDAHERSRLALVLQACDGLYDLVAVYEDECKARELLYSDLDADQRRIFSELKVAGVL